MARHSSPRQRLADILGAIEAIETYTKNFDLEAFTASPLVYDASVRNIEIISEASRHIPQNLKSSHDTIPWRAIADIGNILRHGYDRINEAVV